MHRISTILVAALVSLAITGIAAILDRGRESREKQTRDRCANESAPMDSDSNETTSPRTEEVAGLGALSSDLASLRRQVAALKVEVARLSEASAPRIASEQPKAAMEEEARRQQETMVAEVVGAFQSEPADATWSSANRLKIGEVASRNDGLQHALRGVDCRSHTCRIELADDPKANLGANLSLFISELTGTLPTVTTDWTKAADGTGIYVLYMSGG